MSCEKNFINITQYDHHVMTQNEKEALSQKMKFNLSRLMQEGRGIVCERTYETIWVYAREVGGVFGLKAIAIFELGKWTKREKKH